MSDVLGDRDVASRGGRLSRIGGCVESELAQQPREPVQLPGIHITYDTSQVMNRWLREGGVPHAL
jgi:hypothetical protein